MVRRDGAVHAGLLLLAARRLVSGRVVDGHQHALHGADGDLAGRAGLRVGEHAAGRAHVLLLCAARARRPALAAGGAGAVRGAAGGRERDARPGAHGTLPRHLPDLQVQRRQGRAQGGEGDARRRRRRRGGGGGELRRPLLQHLPGQLHRRRGVSNAAVPARVPPRLHRPVADGERRVPAVQALGARRGRRAALGCLRRGPAPLQPLRRPHRPGHRRGRFRRRRHRHR
mmetsp:Transcript_44339/g.105047  ORF Transcript_44339/g.105047 Transcript_44339/m.105047 type:complete len:228 (+) Transcript_44339:4576-5259(+)